jgi:hypothetical protein
VVSPALNGFPKPADFCDSNQFSSFAPSFHT